MYLNLKMVIFDYEILCLHSSLVNPFCLFLMLQATNYEKNDERKYDTKPQSNFQKFIRLSRAGENLKLHRVSLDAYLY